MTHQISLSSVRDESPSVTVVVPLYNKGRYIARALHSVFRQTYQGFRVVVIDDGSVDDGAESARSAGDARLVVLRQSNAGVSAARNRGFEAAWTEWVAFLDADDEWRPEFLDSVRRLTRAYPQVGAVFGNFSLAAEGPLLLRGKTGLLPDYFQFCLDNDGLGMNASNVVVRKAVLQEIGGFPLGRKMGEDLDTWARLAWTTEVAFISEASSVYHSDAEASATKALTPFNSVNESYSLWRKEGRIPVKLERSSRRWAAMLDARDVVAWAKGGQISEARAVFRRIPPLACPWRDYLYALYHVLPAPAVRVIRWTWRAIVRRLLSGRARRKA